MKQVSEECREELKEVLRHNIENYDDDVIEEMRNNYIMATLLLVPKELEEEFREKVM